MFAVSEADRDAPYTRGREVVVLGPGRAAQSYLDVERVVQAAVQARCSALHPGWGFLSENPLLATLVRAARRDVRRPAAARHRDDGQQDPREGRDARRRART